MKTIDHLINLIYSLCYQRKDASGREKFLAVLVAFSIIFLPVAILLNLSTMHS